MIRTRTYKAITAVFLIAIYVFIACPVQFWHQHNNNSPSASIKEAHSSVSAGNDNADINCGICTHKYSSFNLNSFELSISAPSVYSSKDGGFLESKLKSPSYCFANKGPPVVYLSI